MVTRRGGLSSSCLTLWNVIKLVRLFLSLHTEKLSTAFSLTVYVVFRHGTANIRRWVRHRRRARIHLHRCTLELQETSFSLDAGHRKIILYRVNDTSRVALLLAIAVLFMSQCSGPALLSQVLDQNLVHHTFFFEFTRKWKQCFWQFVNVNFVSNRFLHQLSDWLRQGIGHLWRATRQDESHQYDGTSPGSSLQGSYHCSR